jgi:hypothetical protein
VDLSPILVRPVREQLEHDRVIRLLQAKYKRKFEVAINPGNEQTMPVGSGPSPWYPDLVLQTSDRARKLAGVVEVETAESVNNLEAMSQWVTFGRLRVPFHLYLPTASVDTGRRFCSELDIPVAELWAYQAIGDQLRFTLIHRTAGAPLLDGKTRVTETVAATEPRRAAASKPAEAPKAPKPATRPTAAARPAAAARSRGSNGQPARRSASAPATPARRPAAKAKAAAAPRRAPAAKAAPRRKPAAKGTAPSRAQKRK